MLFNNSRNAGEFSIGLAMEMPSIVALDPALETGVFTSPTWINVMLKFGTAGFVSPSKPIIFTEVSILSPMSLYV
jgi:hypothetical protein